MGSSLGNTIRDINNIALSSRNILLSKYDIKKSSFIAKLLLFFEWKEENVEQKICL